MEKRLWEFTDHLGSFRSTCAGKIKTLYFPLANEKLMSSITPDLHGDIKSGQNAFLLEPVSRIDLVNSRASRNFWVRTDSGKAWSATGVSKDLRQISADRLRLEAGLLWHKIERINPGLGLKAEILSFIPKEEPVEIMQVSLSNISRCKISFIPTCAIPIYARSANNLRDHRQVTSLLQRIKLDRFGIIVKPTLAFDEKGHIPNQTFYFVLGWDEKACPPEYLYPTQEMFCGEAGDLEAPQSILENTLPAQAQIQGREAMGALRFAARNLRPTQSCSYTIIMGITEKEAQIKRTLNKFRKSGAVTDALKESRNFWQEKSSAISLDTADADFNNWLRWVNIQPDLRRIFGCSFLPDFDYGRGGRGWRDLWQDCLGLILSDARGTRKLLVNNFSGVRIDGTNATIIGKKPGEFFSDRNNISRVWMDHGIWPLLTLELYINETGDHNILFEEAPYFRNHELCRCQEIDSDWAPSAGQRLKTRGGKVYQGTIIEHLLVENLVQFFNVGSHNYVRLEGADWNDGLDMAKEFGESVAFSSMYAQNLAALAELLPKTGKDKIRAASELKILLKNINYGAISQKQKLLGEYLEKTKYSLSGQKIELDASGLARDLSGKSAWLFRHIRKGAWLKEGFFNGYYDNAQKQVEGKKGSVVKMMLASQVFPIISGTAENWQIEKIIKSIRKYLFDRKLKGYHLNTDFSRPSFRTLGGIPPKAGKTEEHNLGRAFSFIYGDKENGAFFSHMVVLWAYGLYKRGFAKEAWEALSSLYKMALDTPKSKIYPCLPEYFNLQGQGMYAYLTGSASWFMLTLLAQACGIRGQDGNLLIEPKITAELFQKGATVRLSRIFCARKLRVSFSNPRRLAYPRYRIIKARLNSRDLPIKEPGCLIISRKSILNLSKNKINNLDLLLG